MPGDDQGRPTFSLVPPAYNEESYLPRLLDTVDTARQRHRGGPDAAVGSGPAGL